MDMDESESDDCALYMSLSLIHDCQSSESEVHESESESRLSEF